MSIAEFQSYWRGTHAELARTMPGLRGYVQNHALLRKGRTLLRHPGFDCLPELDFDDPVAMGRALDTPPHQQGVASDEDAFLERCGQAVMVGCRLVHRPGSFTGVKLITLWRTHAGVEVEEVQAALSGPYAASVGRAAPQRHEQLLRLLGVTTELPVLCDAIDCLWFASAKRALAYLGSEVAAEAAEHLAGKAVATGRAIVRPLRIV